MIMGSIEMKKITALFTLVLAISLSSCSHSPYHNGEFFPKDFLKEQLIEELPIPEGDFLYVEKYGFAAPRVCVNLDVTIETYAEQVYNFLKKQNFKYIYTVDRVYVRIGVVPTKEAAYLVKEFTALDECYFEDSYFFVFGNNEETVTNEQGTIFLKDEHMIRIKKDNSEIDDEKHSLHFYYNCQIIINDDPCNVTHIGS